MFKIQFLVTIQVQEGTVDFIFMQNTFSLPAQVSGDLLAE